MTPARTVMDNFARAMQDADRYARELQFRYGYSQEQIRDMAKLAVPLAVKPYRNLASSFAVAKRQLEKRGKQNG